MRLRKVEADRDRLAAGERARIEHATDPVAACEVEEDQRFVAERFGDRNLEFRLMDGAGIASVQAVAGWIEIVGAQAEDDLLARAYIGLEMLGQRQSIAGCVPAPTGSQATACRQRGQASDASTEVRESVTVK